MNRLTSTIVLLLALLAIPIAAWAQTRGEPPEPTVVTVATPEASPVDVAIAFSQLTFDDDQAGEVLIGRDDLFADALSSGFLQGSTSPLLLTGSTSLADSVATEIQRLGATAATIMGGEAAVSPAVEAELQALGVTVDRVAGPSRLETAVASMEAGDTASDTAILARGFAAGDPTQAFADALGAGGLAAAEGWPILLTQTETLSTSTGGAIQDGNFQRVVVIGGTAAIGEDVIAALPDGLIVERVSGATRFDTAVQIAVERGFPSSAAAETIILLDGQDEQAWAAGFAAAATSASLDAPVLLANGDDLPPATADWFTEDTSTATRAGQVDPPTLICAANTAACDTAAELLDAATNPPPTAAALTFAQAARDVVVHQDTTITAELDGEADEVSIVGDCLADSSTTINPGSTITRRIQGPDDPTPAPDGPCVLDWTVSRPDGTTESGQVTVVVDVVEVTFPSLDAIVDADFTVVVEDNEANLRIGSFCFDQTEHSPNVGRDGIATVPVTDVALDIEVACPGEYELTFADGGRQLGEFIPTLRCPAGQVSTFDSATGEIRAIRNGVVTPLHVADFSSFVVDGEQVTEQELRDEVTAGDCVEGIGGSLQLFTGRYLCASANSAGLPRVFELQYTSGSLSGSYTANVNGSPTTTTFTSTDRFRVPGQTDDVDIDTFVDSWEPGHCIWFTASEPHLPGYVFTLVARGVEHKAFRF